MDTNDQGLPDGGMRQEMEERLHARIRAVERQARGLRTRVRWLGLALLGAVALAAFALVNPGFLDGTRLGGSEPTVVEATRIVLVNENGIPRGEWFVDEEGNGRLAMLDQQQRERLLLTVRGAGYPGISLSNAAGQRRVALGLLPDETTSLVFADGAGVPRAVLGLTRGESANLVLADREGVSRIGLGLDGDGMGSVLLPEPEGSEEGSDR